MLLILNPLTTYLSFKCAKVPTKWTMCFQLFRNCKYIKIIHQILMFFQDISNDSLSKLIHKPFHVIMILLQEHFEVLLKNEFMKEHARVTMMRLIKLQIRRMTKVKPQIANPTPSTPV